MATKLLNTDQHPALHNLYGANDCCLCKAEARIKELEKELDDFRLRTGYTIRPYRTVLIRKEKVENRPNGGLADEA